MTADSPRSSPDPGRTSSGFAAEPGGLVLLTSSCFGYPLSTAHIVSGAVLGSRIGKQLAGLRWGLAGQIAVAWLVILAPRRWPREQV